MTSPYRNPWKGSPWQGSPWARKSAPDDKAARRKRMALAVAVASSSAIAMFVIMCAIIR